MSPHWLTDVQGKQLDGEYLGSEGKKEWAFQYHEGLGGDWYEMRLLQVGETMKDGEANGFLRIVEDLKFLDLDEKN